MLYLELLYKYRSIKKKKIFKISADFSTLAANIGLQHSPRVDLISLTNCYDISSLPPKPTCNSDCVLKVKGRDGHVVFR